MKTATWLPIHQLHLKIAITWTGSEGTSSNLLKHIGMPELPVQIYDVVLRSATIQPAHGHLGWLFRNLIPNLYFYGT